MTEESFSAKDFRTWNATVLAAVALAVSGEAQGSKTGRTRAISRAVQEVAHYLGNTPAVCRASYIDPRVFDRFRDGLTIGGALDDIGEVAYGEPATQGAIEEAVLDLLERDLDSPASSEWPRRAPGRARPCALDRVEAVARRRRCVRATTPVARPVVAVSAEGAQILGAVYWREVQRFTRGVIRSRVREERR